MEWHALEVDGPVGTTPVEARLVGDPARRLVLVRTPDGVLHATARACPHLGHSLARGQLDGDVLECAHHHYRYRVTDGVCVGPGASGGPLSGRLAVHEVRETDDGIEIRLTETADETD